MSNDKNDAGVLDMTGMSQSDKIFMMLSKGYKPSAVAGHLGCSLPYIHVVAKKGIAEKRLVRVSTGVYAPYRKEEAKPVEEDEPEVVERLCVPEEPYFEDRHPDEPTPARQKPSADEIDEVLEKLRMPKPVVEEAKPRKPRKPRKQEADKDEQKPPAARVVHFSLTIALLTAYKTSSILSSRLGAATHDMIGYVKDKHDTQAYTHVVSKESTLCPLVSTELVVNATCDLATVKDYVHKCRTYVQSAFRGADPAWRASFKSSIEEDLLS